MPRINPPISTLLTAVLLLTPPLAALGEGKGKVYRIGWLGDTYGGGILEEYRDTLWALGAPRPGSDPEDAPVGREDPRGRS